MTNQSFTNKVDIWALGCILYELCFRQKAFNNDIAVLSYSASNEPLIIPDEPVPDPSGMAMVPVPCKYRRVAEKLIHRMLNVEQANRPSAGDLVALFSSIDESLEKTKIKSLVQISAIHGSGAQYKKSDSFRVDVSPQGAKLVHLGWTLNMTLPYSVFFPIPTPTIADDRRLRCSRAIAKFRTGSKGWISRVQINNDGVKIAEFGNLHLQGDLQEATWNIRVAPKIMPLEMAVVIIAVSFESPSVFGGGECFVELVGVGIEFI
jgi:serine/threonine protein kinase